jgi:hypothetical protein
MVAVPSWLFLKWSPAGSFPFFFSDGVGVPVVLTENKNDEPAKAVARAGLLKDRTGAGPDDALRRESIVPLPDAR